MPQRSANVGAAGAGTTTSGHTLGSAELLAQHRSSASRMSRPRFTSHFDSSRSSSVKPGHRVDGERDLARPRNGRRSRRRSRSHTPRRRRPRWVRRGIRCSNVPGDTHVGGAGPTLNSAGTGDVRLALLAGQLVEVIERGERHRCSEHVSRCSHGGDGGAVAMDTAVQVTPSTLENVSEPAASQSAGCSSTAA